MQEKQRCMEQTCISPEKEDKILETKDTPVTSREYKDRVFCRLFGTEKMKGNLLSLYNALNGTD